MDPSLQVQTFPRMRHSRLHPSEAASDAVEAEVTLVHFVEAVEAEETLTSVSSSGANGLRRLHNDGVVTFLEMAESRNVETEDGRPLNVAKMTEDQNGWTVSAKRIDRGGKRHRHLGSNLVLQPTRMLVSHQLQRPLKRLR